MQLKPLDPRFGKLVALMQSSTHEGERAAARARAEAVLAPSGVPFERALAQLAYEKTRADHPNNPLAGFDEYQEIEKPGHIARLRAERAERARIWAERRAALIEQYGSAKAIIAPCGLKKLILLYVKPWRKACKRPWQRWTESFDGWTSAWDKPPPHIRDAIANAIPLPTTFAQAKAEVEHWRLRNEEIEHGLSEDGSGLGDYGLDLPALARWNMVRDLFERDLPVDNLADLIERFKLYRDGAGGDAKTENALLRDLEAVAAAQAEAPRD